jgi:hypothetical protein
MHEFYKNYKEYRSKEDLLRNCEDIIIISTGTITYLEGALHKWGNLYWRCTNLSRSNGAFKKEQRGRTEL